MSRLRPVRARTIIRFLKLQGFAQVRNGAVIDSSNIRMDVLQPCQIIVERTLVEASFVRFSAT